MLYTLTVKEYEISKWGHLTGCNLRLTRFLAWIGVGKHSECVKNQMNRLETTQ